MTETAPRDGTLEDIFSRLPPFHDSLVSPAVLPHVVAAARRLPVEFGACFGLECRLGPGEHATDLQCGIRHGSPGHLRLLDGSPASTLVVGHGPVWQQVRRFAQAWQDAPAAQLPYVCLGFDLEDGMSAPLLPLVHIRTSHMARDRVQPWLEQAQGSPLAAATAATLQRSLAAASAPPTYLGCMFGRESRALRLTQPLPLAEALPYLDAIAWPGDRARAEELLGRAAAWCGTVGLSLNLGEEVEPYLGLELLNWGKPRGTPAQWRSCLQDLTRWGLCTPAQQAALLAFPGLSHYRPAPGASSGLAEAGLETIARSLMHIKLVLPPGQPPSAKAYLAIERGWLHWPENQARSLKPRQ